MNTENLKIVTHWPFFNPRHASLEKMSDPKSSKVEIETYVPLHQQVERLVQGGLKNESWKRYQYDTDHISLDSLEVDPTRYPGFDPGTAFQMSLRLNRKIQEAKEAAKENNVKDNNKFELEREEDIHEEEPKKKKAEDKKA